MSLSSNPDLGKFSSKRYFVNNVDGYHGQYIVKELINILKSETERSKVGSQSFIGEEISPPTTPITEPYELIGTVSDPNVTKIKDVTIIPKKDCLPQMLTCANVVLDISCDSNELNIAKEFIELLKLLFSKEPAEDNEVDNTMRHFILVSTLMTWAMTKPLDPNEPEMPFLETDFRKRKPHPNYKVHREIENEVIALGKNFKSKIKTTVVAVGVTYGGPEDVLYYWFQKAWECEPLLPILGRGNNAIPLINVADLARIVYNIMTDFPNKHYIVAVEHNITKQKEIIKSLGRIVGSGMFKCIPPEDAFLITELNQRIYDLMTLNLNMEPSFIEESMQLQWVSPLSFAENIPVLIKQFKKERKLRPFKLIIHGPPLIGKTKVAKQISEAYGLVYISPETVVEDIASELAFKIKQLESRHLSGLETLEEGEDDEDELDDDIDNLETMKQNLSIMQYGISFNENEILGYIRQRLLCHAAHNRGWILDGYPNTLEQCGLLFQKGDQEESEEDNNEDVSSLEAFDEDLNLYDNILKSLLPGVVVSLVATDEFICDKAMRQPEDDPRLEEKIVLQRLEVFHSENEVENSPLNFFDEIDIHPLVIKVNDHSDYDMKFPYAEITLRLGSPCQYGKLLELIEEAKKKEKKEMETLKAKEEKIRKELEEKMRQDREEKMEYWSELYALLREEEEASLAAAGEPMRNYLMHHIFPTLTPALLEVARTRPKDPIDFLAEYLFKLNPTGKMLEPGYNFQAELLFGKLKVLDDTLRDLEIKIDPFIPPEAEIGESSKNKHFK